MKAEMYMKKIKTITFLFAAIMLALTFIPTFTYAAEASPAYQSLDELAGKRFAYVNGSVYNKSIQNKLEGTSEEFYPSLSECVAAVEEEKADAAVQLSYCCQLAVNRRPGTVAMLPESVAKVSEGFFFKHGSKLTAKFNDIIRRLSKDGTLKKIEKKWVAADESGKTLPKQDWDAPNGTLIFATSGVIEPFSYVVNV
jgi:ABC-type amino acid transport substrate-binding protein